jgi:hypothetical protein
MGMLPYMSMNDFQHLAQKNSTGVSSTLVSLSIGNTTMLKTSFIIFVAMVGANPLWKLF